MFTKSKKRFARWKKHPILTLKQILTEPAAFDHPATWACILFGAAVGALFGIGLGALIK